jgi:protein TonB
MVVPTLCAERLSAPSARAPRVSMALSLALHGLAVVLLLAAGAAGSASSGEQALLVELALADPSTADAPAVSSQEAAPETAPELPPAEEPPPVDLSMPKPVELAPSQEPPPIDVSELKAAEPPKPAPLPAKREQPRQAARQAAAKTSPSSNFGSASDARQAAAGFLTAPAVVWEGQPRYRHPPTPASYPPRAVELNQQGEVLVRVRLDPEGTAVEIVLHRTSGFPLLDSAAVAAVRRWQFLPAMRDSRPVAAWVEIPVRFHLR